MVVGVPAGVFVAVRARKVVVDCSRRHNEGAVPDAGRRFPSLFLPERR